MRPYPEELVDSVLYSLREVVIPAVDDDWALYVAKCMEKVLRTARTRFLLETEIMAQDSEEMRDLFAEVHTILDGQSGCEDAAAVVADPVDVPLTAAEAAGLQRRVEAANATARRSLVQLIDGLFALEDTDLPAPAAERVRQAHDRVRQHLDRQLARDVQLTSDLFMAFGEPTKARVGERA